MTVARVSPVRVERRDACDAQLADGTPCPDQQAGRLPIGGRRPAHHSERAVPPVLALEPAPAPTRHAGRAEVLAHDALKAELVGRGPNRIPVPVGGAGRLPRTIRTEAGQCLPAGRVGLVDERPAVQL